MVQLDTNLSAGEPSPLRQTLRSGWFLLSTTVACGLAVALTTWLAGDTSTGIRAVAIAIGIVWGLGFMLLVAWALSADDSPWVAAPAAAAPPTPVMPTPPSPVPSAPAPPQAEPRDALAARLEAGRVLQAELEPGTADPRVEEWIDGTRRAIERGKPGVAGYFDALGARSYADDADRLRAHLGRLATIVRDFL